MEGLKKYRNGKEDNPQRRIREDGVLLLYQQPGGREVRGHWAVEIMHWQLDVTFKEDANTTLVKTAAQNQSIIRKWWLSMLKLIEIRGKKMSLKRKRFNISFAPAQLIEELIF